MVNTFVISSSFEETAKSLDYKRLGKQRVEAFQILKSLLPEEYGPSNGWKNHPATLMWKGYEEALIVYIQVMIKEWINRGYKNTIEVREPKNIIMPHWITWKYMHLSHKCSLLRKNAEYYSNKFDLDEIEKEYMKFGYVWPTHVKSSYGGLPKPELVCDPISGSYGWKKEEIMMFLSNRNVNPRTGRKISATSKKGIYITLIKAAAELKLL